MQQLFISLSNDGQIGYTIREADDAFDDGVYDAAWGDGYIFKIITSEEEFDVECETTTFIDGLVDLLKDQGCSEIEEDNYQISSDGTVEALSQWGIALVARDQLLAGEIVPEECDSLDSDLDWAIANSESAARSLERLD